MEEPNASLTLKRAGVALVKCDKARLGDWIASLRTEKQRDLALVVRGGRMKSIDRLFDEFAAVLQFPSYFGGNWDAFDECITDLSWMPAVGDIVIAVESADLVLVEENDEQLRLFLEVMKEASEEWSLPNGVGEEWERGPRNFRLLLQAEHGCYEKLRSRVLRCDFAAGRFELPPAVGPT